jgi:DNA-binding response OmpR family regulator
VYGALPLKKRRRRILLIDNDQRTSYMICLILKLNGYDVQYYADPKSMLSQLQSSLYDLILLSLKSIETSYLELYDQIRNKDAHVKICFMMDDRLHINYTYGDNFVQSFKGDLNSCDFVDKPANTSEILEIVTSQLGKQHR